MLVTYVKTSRSLYRRVRHPQAYRSYRTRMKPPRAHDCAPMNRSQPTITTESPQIDLQTLTSHCSASGRGSSVRAPWRNGATSGSISARRPSENIEAADRRVRPT